MWLVSLLPKVREYFAEFLQHGYLNAWVYSTCSPVSVLGTVLFECNPFPEMVQKVGLSNLTLFYEAICQIAILHHLTVFTANLEADSLCAEHQIAETLELTAIMIFTWFFVTHVSILTFESSNIFHKISSSVYKTLRYLCSVASVNKLSPDTLSVLRTSTSELLRFHYKMAASKPIS